MNVEKIWKMVKSRYPLSSKVKMKFELFFPKYLIANCLIIADNTYEVKKQKISPSLKGLIFSDTIPLSWFTSSVLIPWENALDISFTDTAPSIEGVSSEPLSSNSVGQSTDFKYCTVRLNDPREMTIGFPWSKEFTEYVKASKLFDI